MLPEKFLDRMQRMLGEEYGAFLESFSQEKYQALRLNALKVGLDGRSAAERLGLDRRSATERLQGNGLSRAEVAEAYKPDERDQDHKPAYHEKVLWAENGYYYGPEEQPGRHPYHDAGVYYIQEPSAMAPAELLEAEPGERVLDLCAAPGGKSTQIAAKMQGRGLLVSNEINPSRAKILSENIERMGICNACVTNETPERLADFFPEYFDRILVDAPCSGEGMFRKNEAACGEWSPENVILCAERQDGILDHAAAMLRPGGRLVYSTCTFAPEENEGSIERFLKRHGEFSLLPVGQGRLGEAGCGERTEYGGVRTEHGRTERSEGTEKDRTISEGTLRLWPHRVKGEGHFAAVLQKNGALPDSGMSGKTNDMPDSGVSGKANDMPDRSSGGEKVLSKKKLEEPDGLAEFFRENLRFLPEKDEIKYQKPTESPKRSAAEKAESRPAGKRPGGQPFEKAGRGTPAGKAGRQAADAKGSRELLRRLGETLGMGEDATYIRFGDNLYLVPGEMPSLKGLKVLRPGLHIGEIKKNRFEPSHALALAISPRRAVHTWQLSSDDRMVYSYLRGETFPAEGEKGWYLICVDGFGLGWGKLSVGVMKNHYPKGLRRNETKNMTNGGGRNYEDRDPS